jgi:hypothetical protein
MNDSSDKLFERRARALYHEAGRRLDPATAGRLRAARRTALAAPSAPARHRVRTLLPVGALAAVALAALMVWQPLQHDAAPSATAVMSAHGDASSADNELPPDPDGSVDPGLYQNLDFYSWLASTKAPSANAR